MTVERFAVLAAAGPGLDHLSIGGHDLKPRQGIAGRSCIPGAIADAVLRDRPTDGRKLTRKRSPKWCADTFFFQGQIKFFPRHARLNRHVHIFGIDFDNSVHLLGIDGHRIGHRWQIPIRIRHATTAWKNRHPGTCRRFHGRSQFLNAGRLQDGFNSFALIEYVLAIELAVLFRRQNP